MSVTLYIECILQGFGDANDDGGPLKKMVNTSDFNYCSFTDYMRNLSPYLLLRHSCHYIVHTRSFLQYILIFVFRNVCVFLWCIRCCCCSVPEHAHITRIATVLLHFHVA